MPAAQQATPAEPLSRRSLSTSIAPGTVIGGHYVVISTLGEGGMAQVYLAKDTRLDREVALKVLAADHDDEARARFVREARALAKVEHANVVRVYASGDDGDRAWMALEVIRGDPISSLCDGQPVDEETALLLTLQVAKGLSAVHQQGIVHRDVKPSNVLVDDEGTVKLIDFGISAVVNGDKGGFVTRAGVVVGTPHYMSPEQARGAQATAAADAWGLGALLYTLLTGEPPFYHGDDEPDVDILARVVRDDVPDVRTKAPHTTPAVAAMVASLLLKDETKRAHDLEEVAARLEAIASGVVVDTSEPSPPSPLSQRGEEPEPEAASSVPGMRGERVLLMASAVGVVALVIALVVMYVVMDRRAGVVVERVEVPVEKVVEVEKIVEKIVEVDRPSPDPAPAAQSAAERLRALVEAAPATQGQMMQALLAEAAADAVGDAPSTEALALAAASRHAVGDDVVRLSAELPASSSDVIAARVLSSSEAPVSRQLAVVDRLGERRNDTALVLLSEVANRHKDAQVRARAAAARDSIFRVER